MKKITLAVVIPVGPACRLDYVSDTIESVRHYVTPSHVIIVLDDSGKGTGMAIKEQLSDAVVLTTERNYGKNRSCLGYYPVFLFQHGGMTRIPLA